MSLLNYIDNNRTYEEILDLVNNNNSVLNEYDEFLNAVARSSINLDTRLLDFLLSFDRDWDIENIFGYVMCSLSVVYQNPTEYQKDKITKVFHKLQSLIDISSNNLERCFNYILNKGNVFMLELFIEYGYLDTRDVPECDPIIYYRLQFFKSLRINN